MVAISWGSWFRYPAVTLVPDPCRRQEPVLDWVLVAEGEPKAYQPFADDAGEARGEGSVPLYVTFANLYRTGLTLEEVGQQALEFARRWGLLGLFHRSYRWTVRGSATTEALLHGRWERTGRLVDRFGREFDAHQLSQVERARLLGVEPERVESVAMWGFYADVMRRMLQGPSAFAALRDGLRRRQRHLALTDGDLPEEVATLTTLGVLSVLEGPPGLDPRQPTGRGRSNPWFELCRADIQLAPRPDGSGLEFRFPSLLDALLGRAMYDWFTGGKPAAVCARRGCGRLFLVERPWGRFCSEECRKADYYRRKVEPERKKKRRTARRAGG